MTGHPEWRHKKGIYDVLYPAATTCDKMISAERVKIYHLTLNFGYYSPIYTYNPYSNGGTT
jgi:hypothetical protein